MSILPRSPGTDRLIDTAELARHAATLGRHYALHGSAGQPPLSGHFDVATLPGGILLRHARVTNRCDMRCSAEVAPGIKLILLLGGPIDVCFDGRALPAMPGDRRGYCVDVREPVRFDRRARADTTECSLTLTLPGDWLERRLALLADRRHSQPTDGLCDGGLEIRGWQPSAALCAEAAGVFGPVTRDTPVSTVYRENLAWSLIAEAWPVLLEQAARRDVADTALKRATRLDALVRDNAHQPICLERLARRIGMSRASLQRHFRALYGMSPQRFMRRRRLYAAFQALARDGASVSTAAGVAGYGEAANFATAFRQMFGHRPRDIGARH
ncbi:AraC family transcriptional regulator [Salinisphaera sp. Q1T1-3]|uniref:helix-turn-helix transcriptional regulator n=1 Tax=Salinisphaera sp. Q1T1-3 TaxID=2321229 RepID=UPI000E70A0E6|nr:AraC family transcriptional regulator [Salinisphaera sp. Q1T1-3]RJS94841.1 AraC family transcriptional regulator [Salinisphaera sp. Q1T1-3]